MRFAIPWWVSLIVIVGALLLTVGAIVGLTNPAMLVPPNAQITDAVRIYAGYFVSRNLALAAMLLLMLSLRSRRILSGLMALTAVIQVFDAVLDAMEGRWTLVPGVLLLGVAYLIGVVRLSGREFWRE